MLTDEQLAEIEARTDAATPGPWEVARDYDGDAAELGVWAEGVQRYPVEIAENERDAEFIAATRTDVPALLAEVKRLREELRPLMATAETHHGSPSCSSIIDELRTELAAESNRADVWRAAYEGTLDSLAQQVKDAQEEFSNLLIDEHTGEEASC